MAQCLTAETAKQMQDQREAVLAEYQRHHEVLDGFKRNLRAIQESCIHEKQEQLFTHLDRCTTCGQMLPTGDPDVTNAEARDP